MRQPGAAAANPKPSTLTPTDLSRWITLPDLQGASQPGAAVARAVPRHLAHTVRECVRYRSGDGRRGAGCAVPAGSLLRAPAAVGEDRHRAAGKKKTKNEKMPLLLPTLNPKP